jgi:Rrf2 family protein
MKLTRASVHAVQALIYLARQEPERLVTAAEVGGATGVPARLLPKLLLPLASAGVLVSLRGPRGGYRVARTAAAITLLEVVEAVEGPLEVEFPTFGEQSRVPTSALVAVCDEVSTWIRGRLGTVTLADLGGRG